MDRRPDIRTGLLRDGSRALRALLARGNAEHVLPPGEWYVCPICLEVAFALRAPQDPGSAQDEHTAVPAFVDGHQMAAICAGCDRAAEGATSAVHGHAVTAFRSAQLAGAIRGGQYARAGADPPDLRVHDQAGTIADAPETSIDAGLARMVPASTTGVAQDVAIRVEQRIRVVYGPSRLATIRAAYLVAVACFGWRYIGQAAFDPLRALFRDDRPGAMPTLALTDRAADSHRRQVWVVTTPFERRCVIVTHGQRQVILPVLDDRRTLDQLASDVTGWDVRPQRAPGRVVGVVYPWPATPRYSADPLPRTEPAA